MARPSKYTSDELLDAAVAAVRDHGTSATIAQVSSRTGAPVGSIYHRYPSREHLFISAWLRGVRRFHVGLLATAEMEDPRAALLTQARHVVAFCRESPDDALSMTLYRHRLLLPVVPADLADEVTSVNEEISAMGRDQAERLFGRFDEELGLHVAIAVRQCPYGLVRPFVGGPVPLWLEEAAVAAAGAILDLDSARD